ncbi:MAG: hypothetical protein H0A75_00845 [Candidatus Methanofishera endochildressiae]|uniref:Uncharacterized protein n=1 Tax=Candidatus Methanofishera endochildressiae TaxID=2738884 RepID=A0A7Z0SD14_9GAMM|nr:hypothetical protein [Candidatus Methanofishera endochildressiae]
MTPHAASVELVYRHARPEFVRSDWTWVDKDMDRTRTHPSWWCDHPAEEKKPSTSGLDEANPFWGKIGEKFF